MKILVNFLVLFGLPFLLRESKEADETSGPAPQTFHKTARPNSQPPPPQIAADTIAAHHP